MIRAGNVLVLTYDDIVEGMLEGACLTIPEGARRLMIKADAVEQLNADLGFVDVDDDEAPFAEEDDE
jgi:hypothetical protein